MVDTARHPSRRTVVKAGLWAAPAVAVVNLTSMSAAHASAPTSDCRTTYPSHAFVVFLIDGIYYSVKFGENGFLTPPGDDGNSHDQAFLDSTYAGKTVIAKANKATTPAQEAVYASLVAGLKVATFSNANGVGYTITSAPSGLVAVYAYDGYFLNTESLPFGVKQFQLTGSQFLISKCSG